MPSDWFWFLAILAGAFWLVTLVVVLLKVAYAKIVLSRFPGGIELGGSTVFGKTTYRIVQWLADPVDPQPCPLALHLPGGDLAGDSLCDLNATVAAHKLGAPQEFEIFPFHKDGKIVGISLRLIPEGPPGVRPVAMSIAGKRFSLPLTEAEALRVLGEPIQQNRIPL